MEQERSFLSRPSVLVTGGAGYVGSALIPALLEAGYSVRVVDVFWYGRDVFGKYSNHPKLDLIHLDIRSSERLAECMRGVENVIHLACISNDPSFELDPHLGKSINYDAFQGILKGLERSDVKRFIYASSSSVYGVKETPHVCEEADACPLTDYSKFKWACEQDLRAWPGRKNLDWVIVRPATVCGYASRLRLDLTVNILTIHGLVNGVIRIFGGRQLRPNIHVNDMVGVYLELLKAPREKINRQAFNAGYQNHAVEDIARMVRNTIGREEVKLEYVPSDDQRSYHINSDKIRRVLGFKPSFSIEDAVRGLADAYRSGRIPDPFSDRKYSNIKTMNWVGAR